VTATWRTLGAVVKRKVTGENPTHGIANVHFHKSRFRGAVNTKGAGPAREWELGVRKFHPEGETDWFALTLKRGLMWGSFS